MMRRAAASATTTTIRWARLRTASRRMASAYRGLAGRHDAQQLACAFVYICSLVAKLLLIVLLGAGYVYAYWALLPRFRRDHGDEQAPLLLMMFIFSPLVFLAAGFAALRRNKHRRADGGDG